MDLINQIRLLIAERLIFAAVQIAPPNHPDSVAIRDAARHVIRGGLT